VNQVYLKLFLAYLAIVMLGHWRIYGPMLLLLGCLLHFLFVETLLVFQVALAIGRHMMFKTKERQVLFFQEFLKDDWVRFRVLLLVGVVKLD
jgi:hypothetical protein